MKTDTVQMILVCSMCLVFMSSIDFTQGSVASCVHGGTTYQDGDYFPPNKTFIKTEGPFQCVQCRCSRGLVVCEIENCTFLNCDNPVKYSQFCCLRCPEASGFPKVSPGFLVGAKAEDVPKNPNDCISDGENRAHGSEWQPIIGPLGAMACVRCRCREGNVVCTRLRCNQLPCSHPRREFGECCPVCPMSGNKTALCLPKSSEIFIFKTENTRNSSEKLEYAFWENSAQNKALTVYSWNLRAKTSTSTLTIKILSKEELIKSNLRLIGSITHKRYKKFMQRGEKLQSKCLIQCLRKLKRLENSLGIHTISLKERCTQQEIDVSNL